MNRKPTFFVLASLAIGLGTSGVLMAQPAPPAFKHLRPIHADGSAAERVLPIVQEVPPVEPAPPSMGYYETRWRRWDDVVMPRLPQKPSQAARQAEELPLPPVETEEEEPAGGALPPFELPPLLPGGKGTDPNGFNQPGIPFLPGDSGTPLPGTGEPTPAEPLPGDAIPGGQPNDLEDLFRNPVLPGGETQPESKEPGETVEPPSFDFDAPDEEEVPGATLDLFPKQKPAEAESKVLPEQETPDDSDSDLDDLFGKPLGSSSSSAPLHLQAVARTVSSDTIPSHAMLLSAEFKQHEREQQTNGVRVLPAVGVQEATPRLIPPTTKLRAVRLEDQVRAIDREQAPEGNPLRADGWKPSHSHIRASYESAVAPQATSNPLR